MPDIRLEPAVARRRPASPPRRRGRRLLPGQHREHAARRAPDRARDRPRRMVGSADRRDARRPTRVAADARHDDGGARSRRLRIDGAGRGPRPGAAPHTIDGAPGRAPRAAVDRRSPVRGPSPLPNRRLRRGPATPLASWDADDDTPLLLGRRHLRDDVRAGRRRRAARRSRSTSAPARAARAERSRARDAHLARRADPRCRRRHASTASAAGSVWCPPYRLDITRVRPARDATRCRSASATPR